MPHTEKSILFLGLKQGASYMDNCDADTCLALGSLQLMEHMVAWPPGFLSNPHDNSMIF